MQKKCRRCGKLFKPIDGANYCQECSNAEYSNTEAAINFKDKENVERMRELVSKNKAKGLTNKVFPQEQEDNEYRYLNAAWLDEMAKGLTTGAKKHPGESWHDIPADEHMARAFRHINLARMGDTSDSHLINASMRLMMAYAVSKKEHEHAKE